MYLEDAVVGSTVYAAILTAPIVTETHRMLAAAESLLIKGDSLLKILHACMCAR